MAVDLAKKSLADLQTMAANYRAKGRTGDVAYRDIMVRLGQQVKNGLAFDTTVSLVTQAAKEGRYLSYGEIAEASGLPKSRARLVLPKHLKELNEYARHRGWPMLSAIVVTQDHIKDGGMDEASLAGFCTCARSLGETVEDEPGFLKAQQEAVFGAAKEGRLA